MTLLPKYGVYSLVPCSQEQRRHTVDLFLDLVCPFSARLWSTVVVDNNLPNKYKSRIEFIFRHQIQPWHLQSALVHTVIMGVAREQPTRLFDAITGLFKRQRELFDEHIENKSQIENKDLRALMEKYIEQSKLFKKDYEKKVFNCALCLKKFMAC